MTTVLPARVSSDVADTPRKIGGGRAGADRVFDIAMRATGTTVLLITGGIGLFLALQAIPTLRHYGLSFFTETQWEPDADVVGIGAVLGGTFSVAAVALVVAFPLALATALFISEYAPARLRGMLISMVDLMAAVPSIIYGLWGFFLLQPHASSVARWLHEHLGFLPFFSVEADPQAAVWEQSRAIHSYNHSDAYVRSVLAAAEAVAH